MDYKSGIYKIVNLINGKFYIGSAINLEKRKNLHFHKLRKNKHENKYLQRSFNKYKEINFKFEVLEYVNIQEMLIVREQWYLNLWFDWKNKCYNICPIAGSQLGVKFTKESKRKMSDAKKGKTSPNKGKKLSEETKIKISKSLKGTKYSLGYKHTIKTKLNMAISHGAKPFLVFTKDGFFIGEWINQSECARELEINSKHISGCLKEYRKSHKGYIFKYKDV